MRRRWVGQRTGWILAMVAALSIVAACAGEPPVEAGPLTDLSPTSAPPSTAPPTPEELEAQLISTYRANWAALMTAYAESSVVGLHRVSAGPILYGVSDEILYGIRYGLVFDGVMTHHPRVESMEGEVAIVHDCLRLDDEVRDTLTGEVLDTYQSWNELRVELIHDNGTWKLHDYEYLSEHCEPPAPQI